MKIHPVCALFPEMTPEEYETLKESISKNGVREPVVVHKGFLVDGKHRLKACQELGIKCPSQEWDGKGSLVDWAMDKNLRRRHLSASERSMLAADSLPMYQKEAEAREKAGKGADGSGGRGRKTLAPEGARVSDDGKAASHAAKAARVSVRSVERAAAVAKADPEKAEQVRSGEKTVSQAYKEVKQAEAESKAVEVKDAVGNVVADQKLQEIFTSEAHKELLSAIQKVKSAAKKLCEMPVGTRLNSQDIEFKLKEIWSIVKYSRPYALCGYCRGKMDCRACNRENWITELDWKNAPPEVREAKF